MAMNAPRGPRYGRLGWLATTFALAVALVVGSWLNYRGAVAAVSTLNRGQADLLELAIREVVHPGAPLDSATLSTFLDAHAEAGLRYVALLNSEGGITASAGEPLVPPAQPPRDTVPGDANQLVNLGERVRAWFPRPPVLGEPGAQRFGNRGAPRPSDEARRPGVPDARPESNRQGSRRPQYHLLEFEPVVASGLVARATRSLILAGVAASILTLAALAFWRTSGQYESARLRLLEQQRLTQLGEMSAVLAHEIRNPLASLKGNAQLLAERLPDDSRERARVDRVVAEAARLEALTSDLLDFARSAPPSRTATDPVAVLDSAIADVGADTFVVDTAEAPAEWPLDAGRVRQALVNVLLNARQASSGTAPPVARIARDGANLVFEVRDHGPGLPAGSDARIFDPFFTTRTNGTGLGLAVARRVAEMHGGAISAGNHPDGGAVFRLVLPRG